MKRLLKEPLLHFLLLGGALFAVFAFVNDDDPESTTQTEIVVTSGHIQSLARLFTKTWQRPPTEEELENLIAEHVREEILYREALNLGLDRDDTIVRRRLRQKIEFLSEDILALPEPTDEELTAYLDANPDTYCLDPILTFKHVFLSTDKRGESVDADAAALLEELRAAGPAADITNAGDPLLLEPAFAATRQRDVARLFGEEFAAALATTPTGSWQGTLRSGYGVHLVFIDERVEGRLPQLAEVRDAVLRDWSNEKRSEANEAFYEKLRERYTVTVEKVSGVSVQVSGESK